MIDFNTVESFDMDGADPFYDKNHPFDVFLGSLDHIGLLSEEPIRSKSLRPTFRNILLAHCVTAMETYLYEIFVQTVFDDESYVDKLYTVLPGIRDTKIPLSELPTYRKRYFEILREKIDFLTFHNLGVVRPLFENVLGISFPESEKMKILVHLRHIIVHRNGKVSSGERIKTTTNELNEAIQTTREFVEFVQRQIPRSRRSPLP